MIPDGWMIDKLGDLVDIRIGGTPSRSNNAYWAEKNDGFPWVAISDLKNQSIIKTTKERITELGINNSNVKLIPFGKVIMSFKLTVGKVAKAGINLYTNEAIAAFFIHNNQVLDNDFLLYILPSSVNQIKTDQAVKGMTLNKKKLADIPIILPPLPEQKKIADILSTLDQAIQATQKVIDQTEKVKQGLLQELLTKGIGHTEFKQTELGEIPDGWKVVRFGSKVSLMGGYAFSSKDATPYGARWLKIANVSHNSIKWDKISYLPMKYLESYKEYVLVNGDIVIAMTRPILSKILKIARITERDSSSLLNQRVGKFIFNEDTIPLFVFYLVQGNQFINNIESKIYGTDPPNISSSMIESFHVAFPTLPEQKQIAEVLSSVDDSIQKAKDKKSQLEQVKKGLMQDLLTGKVRVKV